LQLSESGGRLVIASDGIWDALSSDAAAKACRGLPADLAARLVVKVIKLNCLAFQFFFWFLCDFFEYCAGSFEVKRT